MMRNGQIETFAGYSQFKSVEEFNQHKKLWLKEVGTKFSKSEMIALNYLSRFAVKVIGVANVKIATVLKEIHKDYNGLGISRSTFKRMIVKAKSTGLLTTYELSRKNGSQSSNLYVFTRYPELSSAHSEPPKQEKLNHLNKTINLKTKKNKDLNKRNDELDHSYTSERVPVTFVQLVRVFFDNAKQIEEYWHMVNIAAYHYMLEDDVKQMLDVAILAFKQTIRKLKTGRLKNPIAYFYTISLAKFANHFYLELDQSSHFDDDYGSERPQKYRSSEYFERWVGYSVVRA